MQWFLLPTEPGKTVLIWGDWQIRREDPDAAWEVRYKGRHQVWARDPATAKRMALALIDIERKKHMRRKNSTRASRDRERCGQNHVVTAEIYSYIDVFKQVIRILEEKVEDIAIGGYTSKELNKLSSNLYDFMDQTGIDEIEDSLIEYMK